MKVGADAAEAKSEQLVGFWTLVAKSLKIFRFVVTPTMSYRLSGHGQQRILRTTRWSLIRRATRQSDALNDFVSACWYPLYTWARRKGSNPESAEDAVQEFLGKISTNGSLSKVSPVRGSFRSWLLTAFQNHLADRSKYENRLKRGKRTTHISLDLGQAEENYQVEMATIDAAGRAYDRAWALALMDEAMRRLERHYQEAGSEQLIAHLLPALEEPLPDGGYREVARELGMSEAAVRQAVFRMRGRYRLCLLEVAGAWLDIRCDIQLQAKLKELLE